MIEKIIEFSAKNRFIVFLLVGVFAVAGYYSMKRIPVDAIPDLSDTQVIIYSKWDRSPDIIEDQVTYPIVTAMLGAPKVKTIRGFSDFGFSYVYIIFQDGTDIYWARSRTIEYLSKILPRLPEGVRTEIGPDATGVGWVYQYALVDETGKRSLQELRTFQDWYLRYQLQAVPGVAEVAGIGGFGKQYQINIDPNKLLAYNMPISTVVNAVRDGNIESGGRLLEFSGAEYMVRGHGYIKSVEDIEDIMLGADDKGTPVLIKNVANVQLGPDIRRGIADLDGRGDAVGGIVIMRYKENALNVINRVKEKIKEIEPTLPAGMKIVSTYDRSELIERAIETLRHQLTEEMIIVSLIIMVFLWHIPSASLPIATIPIAILLSFIPLYAMKLTSNVMSLSGIAISIGVLVDGAIIEVENAYKNLERWNQEGRKGDYRVVLLESIKAVAPAVFFSLLVIGVAFMPIFTLEDQEGRLFRPLAWAKNLSMLSAAILAVTFVPAVQMFIMRMEPVRIKGFTWLSKILTGITVGTYYPEEKHPISKVLFHFYEPACRFMLKHRKATIIGAIALVLTTIPVYMRLGSEFMPPLNEGTLLYMPATLPGLSVTEAQKIIQSQDKIIKSFPEVESVFGKSGRADTSTDPAPFSMMETTIVLKPENQWRKVPRWYSAWVPEFLKGPFRTFWPEHFSYEELINEMDKKLQFAGVTNSWTMPVKARTDMLTTGVRTPIGIKIYGANLEKIEEIGTHLEMALKDIKGTRSVYAERIAGGYFIDFDLKRKELARYKLSVAEAQMVIMSAIGGENITTTVEGRERYPVNVRYAREMRDDVEKLKRVLVPTPAGMHIPLAQIADLKIRSGPSMIRDENGLLSAFVFVDMAGRDIGSYVTEAKKAVEKEIKLEPGYTLKWSGQYENMQRVKERMKLVLPLTLFLICMLLYMNTKSLVKTVLVLLAVPFSLVGAIWLLWILGYNISIAVWVGMIALMGLDAETGVFMLLYLDLAYHEAVEKGKMKNEEDLEEAIIHGAVKRVRPKMMTVMAAFMGLLPIMWATGTGSDVMKRIATPMVGGLFTSFLMELLVYPVIYAIWKGDFGILRQGKKTISKAL